MMVYAKFLIEILHLSIDELGSIVRMQGFDANAELRRKFGTQGTPIPENNRPFLARESVRPKIV